MVLSRNNFPAVATPPTTTTMVFSSFAARCGRSSLARSSTSRIIGWGGRTSRLVPPQSRFVSTGGGGAQLAALQQENPHTNVVHYTHKNLTFTVQQVNYYSEALAIGLAENGLTTGDVVLSWLPQHFAESMILQFACAKAGFVLYHLDPTVTTEESAQLRLSQALHATNANIFISQEAGNDTNYIRIAERIIPELRFFDYASGMPFVTPHYPHLRLCIHTGFDQEDKWGWLPYKHMMVPSNTLDQHIPPHDTMATLPLAGILTDGKEDTVTVGQVLTHQDLLAQPNVWPSYNKVLQREFHTVEGVGVVF